MRCVSYPFRARCGTKFVVYPTRFSALILSRRSDSCGAYQAILVYDITRPDSFDELQRYYEELKTTIDYPIQLMVVGTKADLKDKRCVDAAQARKVARAIGTKHFLVSSTQNTGVHGAFRELTEMLLLKWPNGPPSHGDTITLKNEKPVIQPSESCAC